jgi:MFS superfamily sulfate permease-like transporter
MAQSANSVPSQALQACCIVAYSIAFFVFGMQVNMLGPTASVVAQQVGVVEADLGIVFTVNGIASIIGGLPSGEERYFLVVLLLPAVLFASPFVFC